MAFHSWRYGPNGQARIFTDEADIPEGWEDHPSKLPADKPLDEINELRAAYKEKFGKKPWPAWDEATLREKMG